MTPEQIELQRSMAGAARELHRAADWLVNSLEGSPLLLDDSAAGDEARAAFDGARRWRSLVESGE